MTVSIEDWDVVSERAPMSHPRRCQMCGIVEPVGMCWADYHFKHRFPGPGLFDRIRRVQLLNRVLKRLFR